MRKKYRTLFENMLEGFAYCKMLFDDEGQPIDWIYIDVNPAFYELTGLEDIQGKKSYRSYSWNYRGTTRTI
nr:PAS domain-containing protein [Methanobacterium formicicum]